MELEGKVVAVTGAGRGMGAATARLFGSRGARVVLAGRGRPALDAVAAEIAAAGGTAVAQVCDVTDPRSVQDLVDAAVGRFGRLDVLVANAGVARAQPLADGRPEDWTAMIDTNLRGVLHGIAAALPVFRSQESGHFVTVTSTSSIKWVPGQGVYAATKAGVRALCEVLRQEVGPQIRVSMICPGITNTEFLSTGDPETVRRLTAMSMEPEAIADAIAYVVGQAAGVDVAEVVLRSSSQP